MPGPAAREQIIQALEFLQTQFGYSTPFDIPARIKDRVIVGWRNDGARRQVEVSGDEYGYNVHCEVRRVIDGHPGNHGADSIGDWELRWIQRQTDDDILLDRGLILQRIVQTLRDHSALLHGTAWIERTDIDRKLEPFLTRLTGPLLGEPMPDSLVVARARASFLVDEHGFVLEFDSSTVSPHEHEMWRTLRYRRGETIVEISNTDIRLPNEWAVRLDGETVRAWMEDWDENLAGALSTISQRLRSQR